MDLSNQLIVAHNGLRERIASRMNVANMVLNKWSKQLSTMAENWANQCRPNEDDECTHTSLPMSVETLINISQTNQQEMFVAMNHFCITSLYLPRELLQMAFNAWYFEKDHMQAPKKQNFQNLTLGLLSGENNFTHLAFPRVRRIGCSVARLKFHKITSIFFHENNFICFIDMTMTTAFFASMIPTTDIPRV